MHEDEYNNITNTIDFMGREIVCYVTTCQLYDDMEVKVIASVLTESPRSDSTNQSPIFSLRGNKVGAQEKCKESLQTLRCVILCGWRNLEI